MRKGRMLLTGFLMGSLLLSGCSRNSALQVVVPKKEQDSVLLSQGDETSVQEQVQAPVRYLCDKDFSNFRLVANARVIVPDVEGICLEKDQEPGVFNGGSAAFSEHIFKRQYAL